jgi:2-dehydropantoate 2-reductase
MTLGRFVIYGAGAIGGVLGARLHESGRDVTLIARGRHLDSIREGGLGIVTAGGPLVRLSIPAVADPADLALTEHDVVVLGMKSQDTDDALRALAVSAPPEIPVICAQNGVANERAALRFFTNVYAMCVTCPAGHLEPGVVEAYNEPVTGRLDLGRYPTGVDETAEAIAAAIRDSTFHCDARPDVMRSKYRKLLSNTSNAVLALTGNGDEGDDLVALLRHEAQTVLDAAGIDYVPAEEFAAMLRTHRGDTILPPAAGRTAGSTWQSLQRGTRSVETAYLNGEIVLLARLHGVAAPANEAILEITEAAAREGLPPESFTVEELRELIQAASASRI